LIEYGGVDERPVVGEEPLHAVRVAPLLVGGEGEHEVARRA
jgi:hypothetical protein